MYKSMFVIILLFSFVSKINANPFISLTDGIQSFFDSPSCVERGGIKLDAPYEGRHCASGPGYRDCRCGDQCILSGEWCCNGEACNEEEFNIVNRDFVDENAVMFAVAVNEDSSLFHNVRSIFHRVPCAEKGGIKLNQPISGFNCGMGKSYRSCRCEDQCIVAGQFCCDGIICDEETFYNSDLLNI